MKFNIVNILLAFLCVIKITAQSKFFKINLVDGEHYLTTMGQSNDLFLNIVRYGNNDIEYESLSKKEEVFYVFSNLLFSTFLAQPITHEFGHQSVLNEVGIGSISKPFLDKNLVARVTGVTDATLMDLRDNNLSNYIRLHTGGLESDYTYLKKSDAFFNFNEENAKGVKLDYFMRKLGTVFYYLSYKFPEKKINEFDEDELNRDIVGHDIYGMVRHLHRPSMNFYRYTEFDSLTLDEKNYVKRMGYLSLLNFINPNVWMCNGYDLNDNLKANFSVNYSLTPFGDFTEQNAYLLIKEKYKINPYFRQYFNKNQIFLAGGVNLHNYCFNNEKFILNSSIDLWNQPKNLDFRTDESRFGFGIKSEIGFRFANWNEKNKSAYINIGSSYKTNGFIPEAPSLREDFRVHLGFIISSKQ